MVHVDQQSCLSRRTLLTASAVAAGIGVLGPELLQPTQAGAAVRAGILHPDSEIARVRSHRDSGAEPWASGWGRLLTNSHASTDYASPRALETVVRGDGDNVMTMMHDIHCAYQNGLRYQLADSSEHGAKAVEVLNA